ncbi:hypothetical protein Tco_1400691 [Tanacetum coccineum]
MEKKVENGLDRQTMGWTIHLSYSLDSSEDSVGTPAGRVILFGTIPTTIPNTTPVITLPATQTDTPVIPTETPIIAPTIPPSPDYTPASPDYSPHLIQSYPRDPSSNHIPPLHYISPFLSSDDDTTDSDTPDTPPSPTHGTPSLSITRFYPNHLSYLIRPSSIIRFPYQDASSDPLETPQSRRDRNPPIHHPLSDHLHQFTGTSAGPSHRETYVPDDICTCIYHLYSSFISFRAHFTLPSSITL